MYEDVDLGECPKCEGDVAHEIVVELEIIDTCVAGKSGTGQCDYT
jgi:hypothetical protein